MLLRIPRDTSKRYAIGSAALEILNEQGPLSTKEIYELIDQSLLQPSTQPLSYLSNALSKDARFIAGPNGWVPHADFVNKQGSMFE